MEMLCSVSFTYFTSFMHYNDIFTPRSYDKLKQMLSKLHELPEDMPCLTAS